MILKSTISGREINHRSNAILEKMRRSLGFHCGILRLNTVTNEEDAIPVGKSSWISAGEELAYLANPGPVPTISSFDKAALHKFTRELVAQSVIPHMERCVAMWNDQVKILICLLMIR